MDQEEFELVPEAVEEQDDLDPNNPNDAFAILERDYKRLICQMEEITAIEDYIPEYQRMFDFLAFTREESLRLANENAIIKSKLEVSEEQLATINLNAESDAITITSLKEEVAKSHKLLDIAHSREQSKQEVIDNLRMQIQNLNAEIELKNKLALGILDENPNDIKNRETLQREKLQLISQISKLDDKVAQALTYQEDLEKRADYAEKLINELNTKLEETTYNLNRYKSEKKNLEELSVQLKMEVSQNKSEIEKLGDLVKSQTTLINQKDEIIKLRSHELRKYLGQILNANNKNEQLKQIISQLKIEAANAQKTNSLAHNDLKNKESKLKKFTIDIAKLTNTTNDLNSQIDQLYTERDSLIEEKDHLKEKLQTSINESDVISQKSLIDKEQLHNLEFNKKELVLQLKEQKGLIREHLKVIEAQGLRNKNLELEILNFKTENIKKQKKIAFLNKERRKIIITLRKKARKAQDFKYEVTVQKSLYDKLKKDKEMLEISLRNLSVINQTMETANMKYLATIQDTTAERSNLKDKNKLQQIENNVLKDIISSKEKYLIHNNSVLKKVVKTKDSMKLELGDSLKLIENLKEESKECRNEVQRLQRYLMDSQQVIKQLNQNLTKIYNEKDILGFQLFRRNDELHLVYEKIKILQIILKNGEANYNSRLDDIKLLKIEVKRLRHEKLLLTNTIKNTAELKQEVLHLERDLTRQRLKCAALEQEIKNPLNIHRWRKLEGDDPTTMDLIQKVGILQKKLIQQNAQIVDKDTQLKELEKMYLRLQQMCAKQSHPNVEMKLFRTQSALSSSTRKVKCLITELNMAEVYNKDCQSHLKQKTSELHVIKRKLSSEKKKRAKEIESFKKFPSITATSKTATSSSGSVKYAGGGFRFAVSVSAAP